MMQRDEYGSDFCTLSQHDEDEIPRNEVIYNFFKYHMSFKPSEIPSTSHHGSDFAENSVIRRRNLGGGSSL